MVTKAIAQTLPLGTVLHHITIKNADGTPARARVNGRCKTWKTRKYDFRLPMKHGLRNCFYIDVLNAAEWNLPA